MATAARTFGEHLSAWQDNQDAPWGRLRYAVELANLRRHLPDGTLRVLDAGGGDGRLTVPLAADGHSVTLVDYSDEMLASARRRADDAGVAARVTLRQAPLDAVPSLLAEGAFDLVLCHNVLQYVDDVAIALGGLCRVLRPGGLISVVCVNRYSEAYRRALMRSDLAGALAALATDAAPTSVFGGAPMRLYSGEEMRRWLAEAGCAAVGEYGVRCVCDYIQDNEAKRDPAFFARLEQLELALSGAYPYYLLARFFQLVARKADAGE